MLIMGSTMQSTLPLHRILWDSLGKILKVPPETLLTL